MIRALYLLFLPLALLRAPGPAEDTAAAYARAVSLQQAGDVEGAVRAYREALARDPGNAQVRSNLGAALASLGRYAEAISAYREALAAAPGNAAIRTNLALAYYKSADIARAAEELEALHEAQPAELRTTLLLADCRLQMGEHERVEALLRPLEAADPKDRTVQYLLGMALVRGGKPEEGQQRIERLMQAGDSAEGEYLLGSASFAAKDYPKAVEHFGRALARESGAAGTARFLRAVAALHRRRRGRAGGAARRARRPRRTTTKPHYYLASILANRQKPAEARPLAERAVQLRPQLGGGAGTASGHRTPRRTRRGNGAAPRPRRAPTRRRRSSASPRRRSSCTGPDGRAHRLS